MNVSHLLLDMITTHVVFSVTELMSHVSGNSGKKRQL